MRKNLKKMIVFLLILGILFVQIQDVLRYKWENHEFISTRLQHYMDEDDPIDVLFFGSSPVYAGITPIAMWNSNGITGMNFGTSLENALCNYFQFEFAIQEQLPKVVVLDLAALFEERKADEEVYEATYRKIAETMPNKKLKEQMINEIVDTNENQDKLSYYFPLLRYHARWNELEKTDFVPIRWYKNYFKGGLLNNVSKPIEAKIDKVYNIDELEIADYSVQYYKQIIERCKNLGINMLVFSPPQFERNFNYAKFALIEKFCESMDVDYVNYNEDKNLEKLNLNFNKDFYDPGHLSVSGSIKLTIDLGERIQKLYSLENHKADSGYEEWNEQWDAFLEVYSEQIE